MRADDATVCPTDYLDLDLADPNLQPPAAATLCGVLRRRISRPVYHGVARTALEGGQGALLPRLPLCVDGRAGRRRAQQTATNCFITSRRSAAACGSWHDSERNGRALEHKRFVEMDEAASTVHGIQ